MLSHDGLSHQSMLTTGGALPAKRRALKYLRILWCLRQMETAPCSWGVPFLGHTYALFKAVHQRPSTWDLFSIWGQKTGTVRRLRRTPSARAAWTHRRANARAATRAGADPRPDLHAAVRRYC